MKRILFSISCICSFLLLCCISCGCSLSQIAKSKRSFDSLINSHTNEYVVKENYDLSIKTIKASCTKRIQVGNDLFYTDKRLITIDKGQVIILPEGCVLLSDDGSHIIGSRFVETNHLIKGYIASDGRKKIKCPITERIVLKTGTNLRFTTGSISNGVIDIAGNLIEAPEKQIFKKCIVTNIGNETIKGRWFFENNQTIQSEDLGMLSDNEVDFKGLNLFCKGDIRVLNAKWKNLNLTASRIYIGNDKALLSGFSISKNGKNKLPKIETNANLSQYIDGVVLLSFGEHVHYDWREKNGKPTLFRGLTSVITQAKDKSFIIEDSVEDFQEVYSYMSSDNRITEISSTGYIYEPCIVNIDNCKFKSTSRIAPGFMYINAGKRIVIKNSSWTASSEGTPSLLGVNNSVGGIIEDCSFTGAYYEGTKTSYGLQLFGSTRINVRNCTFAGNRRGLDFSGSLCQSRYCVVEDCTVSGDIIEHSGSGLGGHSTSFGNIYRNNIIEGSSSRIGIQTRGEYEVIEGNVFKLPFSAAAITCVENATIRNNECVEASTTFVWIESISRDDNTITIENNRFKGNNLIRGQEVLTCKVIVRK